jgi:hypothetical protein
MGEVFAMETLASFCMGGRNASGGKKRTPLKILVLLSTEFLLLSCPTLALGLRTFVANS